VFGMHGIKASSAEEPRKVGISIPSQDGLLGVFLGVLHSYT